MIAAWERISFLSDDNQALRQQFTSPLARSGCSAHVALPIFMKSDLYWQVMPKPKSLQKPVSFLITYRREKREKRARKSEPTGLAGFVQPEQIQPRLSLRRNVFHGGFDRPVLPAVAPQAGRVRGSRRSEQGCTG